MEASMLLGRSINTDRARMLAIQGDQVGVMEEILRQVGGEAEFNRLNVLQRRALAESVGVNVEQLSRLVRNNQASASDCLYETTIIGNQISFSLSNLQSYKIFLYWKVKEKKFLVKKKLKF